MGSSDVATDDICSKFSRLEIKMEPEDIRSEFSKMQINQRNTVEPDDSKPSEEICNSPGLAIKSPDSTEKIYEVKEIDGKNMGCVALRDIEIGETILKEMPQIKASSIRAISDLSEAFNEMSKPDQEDYMNLYDKYADISSLPSDLKLKLDNESQSFLRICGGNEIEAKIYKICKTNGFA